MIQDWIAASLAGVCLGVALFGCVRLRMYFGPVIRERYGNRWRQVYWAATLLAMVLLANGALLVLRRLLNDRYPPPDRLLLEAWFAFLALVVGFALVFKRIKSRR